MRGRTNILELFAGEDVEGDEMDFGVSVLPGLGSRHFHDFARTTCGVKGEVSMSLRPELVGQ